MLRRLGAAAAAAAFAYAPYRVTEAGHLRLVALAIAWLSRAACPRKGERGPRLGSGRLGSARLGGG
jgi:hypothetical protein